MSSEKEFEEKGKYNPNNCDSCIGGEEFEEKCPKSERKCGHHCNHSVTHDECCWCGKTWGIEE